MVDPEGGNESLASGLPYPQRIDPQKAELAMKIGNTYHLREIRRNHSEACARDLRMPADTLPEENLDAPVIGRLVDSIDAHARSCRVNGVRVNGVRVLRLTFPSPTTASVASLIGVEN